MASKKKKKTDHQLTCSNLTLRKYDASQPIASSSIEWWSFRMDDGSDYIDEDEDDDKKHTTDHSKGLIFKYSLLLMKF